MRTILIDDEQLARDKTRLLLETYASDVQIIAEADGVQAGLKCIQDHQPELVLLDIEMNDGTGFDLLQKCPEINFKVIFITSHDAFAIRAFRVSAIDYLLKPIDIDDLLEALKKAKEEIHSTQISALSIQTLLQNQQKKSRNEKLVLSDAENIYLIEQSEIIRCQSEGNYTKFFLTENRNILIAKTLKTYIDLLDGKYFFRSHRSHLINLQHFQKYEKKEGGSIHLKDGSCVPIATGRKDHLMTALKTV